MKRSNRTWLFKLVALLVPLLLLALLELTLRLLGYGHDLRLFTEDAGNPEYLVMNRYASQKFFLHAADATTGNQERFRKEKPASTFRIFVLGESTTLGYPYMHNGSFHRLLKYRLMHASPGTNLEIINLSLTAVNSYTVLDFAGAVAQQQPDAVLIYCGHNEYYGAMGVGSTNRLGNNPWLIHMIMALRTIRTGQLLMNMIDGMRGWFVRDGGRDQTLMRRMADQQKIPYGSRLYGKGILQFGENIDAVCRLFSQRGIPVFISNLVSNEKDQRPFISEDGALSAGTVFHQGMAAYEAGDYKTAKQAFVRAKDLDLLRFRAPDTLNTMIRTIAAHYPNVYFVDTRRLFEQHSPYGILGAETLLEHVHPNLYGYALLSEAFYRALKEAHIVSPRPDDEIPFDVFVRSMPVTRVDSLKGAFEIAQLRMQWPFNEPQRTMQAHGFEERLALDLLMQKIGWNEAMDTLLPYYIGRGDLAEALKVAESTLLEYPEEPAFYSMAGRCSLQLGNSRQAAFYMRKAFELQHR
ncbi:MAG: hypothetical protein J0H74_05600 [Chitinophagaceae bacterium]|nr:hypothetical protein [Chitinophagaceae bacterium]